MDTVWEKVVSLQPEYLLLNDRNYEYWRQGAWSAGMGERLQRHRFERMESKVKLIRWK